ncbi:TRAP transporter small permease [Paenibacillus sp. GCM10027626]|uniref:TRAP transporter small permease n=1 Tax=Paenibacillus sp. GCM10027626 TaxID=3273411 RepID=UPI0036317CE9
MKKIIHMIDLLNKAIMLLLAIMIGLMCVFILMQISSRYFLHISLSWTEEVSRYLMIYAAFFGAAIALRNKSLIAVEFIAEKMTADKRKFLKALILFISIIFFGVVLFQGLQLVDKVSSQQSVALQISMAVPYASIPIGCFLLIVNAIATILDLFVPKEGEVN